MGKFFNAVDNLGSCLRHFRSAKASNDLRAEDLAGKSFNELMKADVLDMDDRKVLEFILRIEGRRGDVRYEREDFKR
ncbi:MAG TPA: hypothetical protein DCZ94_08935 [Lentisphaeria bacterium]|nr:MAG: hypothetical protein A2X48_23470 [Lentisphaerae bacterium GWF2_49_21]HBC87065.1 hypothetical protein [Lentisphaeria bacterium]